MDNNERDYLRQQIQELTRANRRWKVLAIFVTMAFVAFLIAGAFSILGYGAFSLPAWRQAELARMEAELARAQAEEQMYAQRMALEERRQALEAHRFADAPEELLGYPKPEKPEDQTHK